MPIFIDGIQLETFKFPGGECQVKLDLETIWDPLVLIKADLFSSDDIMNLLLAVDAIRRIKSDAVIWLIIPYFPYARQDRVCNVGEALSIKVMADLINSLNCQRVQIYDPHSEVTPALIKNCEIVNMAAIISRNLGCMDLRNKIINKNLKLISPDAGAEKKVRETAKALSIKDKAIEVICATKIRNTITGEITSTKIHDDVKGKDLIVLDDICDGGRTFIELAKVLKESGANDIYLYVTHGIFSKGLEVLKEHFKHVYCYHTMLPEQKIDTSFLTILSTNN